MQNKKIASEIAIGIILLMAIIIGAIFWLQGQKTQTPAVPQQAVLAPQTQPVQHSTVQPSEPVLQQPADETADWQTYSNAKLEFSIKYPADWVYVGQNDIPGFVNGFLFLKNGHEEEIAKSENPLLEMSSVPEYLEMHSLTMTDSNFKDFDPKQYVTRGLDGPGVSLGEEIVTWEGATTVQGLPVYFYTTKIKDKSPIEFKYGAIFVNSKERKIFFIERGYKMDGSKISDSLNKTLRSIALSFNDMQK